MTSGGGSSAESPRTISRVAFGACTLALAFGVFVRFVVATGRFGPYDADEAVVGLMARHLLDGDVEAFFWGQEYGGIHEAVLLALLFALRVPTGLAMELLPVALAAAGGLLVWRIGRRIDPASPLGVIAGLVYWCGSPVFIWWSTKLRGFYGATLVLGLLLVLLTLRIADERRRLDVLLFGLVAGSGWYASPMIVYLAIPAAVAVVWFVRDDLGWAAKASWLAVVGVIVGALPWIVPNLANDFASLEVSNDIPHTTYGERLTIFHRFGLPTALGFKVPMTLGWVGPQQVTRNAWAVALVVLCLATIAAIVSRQRIAMIGFGALVYPFVFALIPTSYYYGEPRYLFVLWPMLCLVGAWAVTRLPLRAVQVAAPVLVVGVAAVTVIGLRAFVSIPSSPVLTLQDVAPPDLDEAIAYLEDHDIDRGWGDYWLANRVMLQTDEDIVIAAVQLIRRDEYENEVREEDGPLPYLVVAGDCYDQQTRIGLNALGIPFGVVRAGGVNIIQPALPVDPEQLLPVWARARGMDVPGGPC